VLVHGAGFNSSMWYPNVAALGRDHPVFALDTPGDPNRSVARAPIAEPAASAAWLDEVLDKLGLGPGRPGPPPAAAAPGRLATAH
jgi:pimeloyl-ACP methyl ester carboxylesterase